MLDPIKPASKEEIESIAEHGDLTSRSSVVSCGGIKAVIRNCVEVDPVDYGDASDSKKLMFIWGLEQMLRAMGYTEYYFNIHANEDMQHWREIVEKYGATAISTEPEIRFKKAL